MIKDTPLIQDLLSLDLPTEDYAIFGSGPMFAHGIKDLGHDIDILARGSAWEKAITLNKPKLSKLGFDQVVELFEGKIEIFDGWAPGEWDTDKLIDTADVIEGIRFISLENVVKWKKIIGREKDFEHIKMIENYLVKK